MPAHKKKRTGIIRSSIFVFSGYSAGVKRKSLIKAVLSLYGRNYLFYR